MPIEVFGQAACDPMVVIGALTVPKAPEMAIEIIIRKSQSDL